MSPRATFAWSVRRELWEHRSLYIAPLAVAGIVLFGFVIHLRNLAEPMRALGTLDIARQTFAVVTPFSLAASVILFTSFIVALFYCLDSLYGERRDRSILFWKSMPVSDRTTVLSKAFIPLVLLPVVAFCIALATQLLLLLFSCVVLLASGVEVSTMWSRLPLGQMTVVMAYGLVVHALWYAPIYGWLMVVSAWAKKAPFLWSVLPVFAAFVVEKIGFGTGYVSSLVQYRVMGAMREAFAPNALRGPITELSQLEPMRFLATPGLWVGLAFAVAFLVLAIRMRRSREPI